MPPKHPPHPKSVPPGLAHYNVEQHTLTTRDGVKLYYETVGEGRELIVLANGLGGRLYAWTPMIQAFAHTYRFVTWDYRGLFESDAPTRIRRLSIYDHAEDIGELLKALGADTAHIVGWSMGVQVGLEFATLYPERTSSLCLLNGTYGRVFDSVFQPLFPLLGMHNVLHGMVEWMSAHPQLLQRLGSVVDRHARTLAAAQARLMPKAGGEIEDTIVQYLQDVFATETTNYLRLFQELDAHSVYHLLPHVEAPALIISGGLDVLTPAYQSRHMAKRIPQARHRHLRWATHYALLEQPEAVLLAMQHFYDDIAAGRLRSNTED